MRQNRRNQNSLLQVVSRNDLGLDLVMVRSHRFAPAKHRYPGKRLIGPAICGMPASKTGGCRTTPTTAACCTATPAVSVVRKVPVVAPQSPPAAAEASGWHLPAAIWAAMALSRASRS